MEREQSNAVMWSVEFRDERAPNYKKNYETQEAATEAAQRFATTAYRRAYVYGPQGLVGWCHNGEWYWD